MLLVSLLYCGCSMSQDASSMIKIYYVPLGAETYVPMTVENIEEHYIRYVDLEDSSSEFKKIMSLVQPSAPGKFDEKSVRVKIDSPNHENVYIDNHGVVKFGESSFLLAESNLKKVKKMLEDVTQQRQPND